VNIGTVSHSEVFYFTSSHTIHAHVRMKQVCSSGVRVHYYTLASSPRVLILYLLYPHLC